MTSMNYLIELFFLKIFIYHANLLELAGWCHSAPSCDHAPKTWRVLQNFLESAEHPRGHSLKPRGRGL